MVKISKNKVYIIALVVLVLSLVLNIKLWCTELYDAPYTAEIKSEEGGTAEVVFDKNTFSLKVYDKSDKFDYCYSGFYILDDTLKADFYDADCNLLLNCSNEERSFVFKHTSVFSITLLGSKHGLDKTTTTYYCRTAIALQVFYGLLFVGSILLALWNEKRA